MLAEEDRDPRISITDGLGEQTHGSAGKGYGGRSRRFCPGSSVFAAQLFELAPGVVRGRLGVGQAFEAGQRLAQQGLGLAPSPRASLEPAQAQERVGQLEVPACREDLPGPRQVGPRVVELARVSLEVAEARQRGGEIAIARR